MTLRFPSEQLSAGWSRIEPIRQDGDEDQEFSFRSVEFGMSIRHWVLVWSMGMRCDRDS